MANTNPIQETSKTSKLAKLNPFHSHQKADAEKAKQKDEVPPKLQEAIQQMEDRKRAKVEEMEKEGKKPNAGGKFNDNAGVAYTAGSAMKGLAGGLSSS
jgi:hypothetical protein